MTEFFVAIAEGIVAFTATNIDDLVLLLLFFAQVDASFRPYHVVLGSYAGFAVLVALSLVGFLAGLVVSPAWIGLLGLLPLVMGIRQLLQSQDEDPLVQTVSAEVIEAGDRPPALRILTRLLHPQGYQVAAVTFANGGDNIGIYVPLFASSTLFTLGVLLSVFFILKGVWCYVAYQLTRQPKVAQALARYGHRLVPFVLIGLGLFILWKNGTLTLLQV